MCFSTTQDQQNQQLLANMKKRITSLAHTNTTAWNNINTNPNIGQNVH